MTKPRSLTARLLCGALLIPLLAGCATNVVSTAAPTAESAPQGTKSSTATEAVDAPHRKEAEPDYALVFPQDSVNRIDITLTPEAWTALQSEMTDQFGTFGEGSLGYTRMGDPQQDGAFPTPHVGEMPEGFIPPEGMPETFQPPEGMPENFQPPQGMPRGDGQPGTGGPGGGGGMGGFDFGDTSYVKSTINFNGETWEDVGFRYSGNSTLQTSWRNGTLKISFRLDFDEFEGENPAIEDQRFHGFKQISFKSNAMDDSYIREKAVSDIFQDAGVVSSQTAFYEVYIDYGEGAQYFGVFTAVEIVDDTLIESQFSDDSGNVYKPEGSGAAFVAGTFSKEGFEKQTNEDEADWSDIQALFEALHSDQRTSDPAAWRAGLEAVFDVDAFLRWLAVDTMIQNWDTYGSMAHNYYLYNDPEDSLLTWIPWDNNMALSGSGGMGGGGGLARGGQNDRRGGARELDITSVSNQWPLISYLADDPVYLATYRQYLEETLATTWRPDELSALYTKYHDLIAPYVEKETEGYTQMSSYDVFERSLDELISHAQERYDAVKDYLAE